MKVGQQFSHLLFQSEESHPHPLNFLWAERACLDPSEGLLLHETSEQLDDSEHQLEEPVFYLLRVSVNPLWQVLSGLPMRGTQTGPIQRFRRVPRGSIGRLDCP